MYNFKKRLKAKNALLKCVFSFFLFPFYLSFFAQTWESSISKDFVTSASVITNGGSNLRIFLPEYNKSNPFSIPSISISLTSNFNSIPIINPLPRTSLITECFSFNLSNPCLKIKVY